jgi:integrase
MQGLSLPDDNRPRERRISWREVRAIVRALGYVSHGKPANRSQETALAFLLALRTAMRAGELLGLTPADVDLTRRVAVLHETKNGDARRVPLSRAAVRLFKRWDGWTVDSATRDTLFRRARDACGISDLHFHDSRAEALTRMSAKLTPFELARVSGHRDMRILLERYFRASAEDIALKL